MKKGLAVIYDPHNLYQFIWYLCTYGKDSSWDALCLPNGSKGEYMGDFCERSQVFSHVYRNNVSFESAKLGKKLGMFVKMFFYYMRRKQLVFCKELLREYIDIDDYQRVVVLCDIGIVSGACIGLGKMKDIVILEDGTADYADRPRGYFWKHILNANNWQGMILAKMGYANPAHYYPLESTRYCEKFSSHPDSMKYTNYKSIKKLYDFRNTDEEMYNTIMGRLYPEVNIVELQKADIIVFSSPLNVFVKDTKPFLRAFEEHINCTGCEKIVLKKHPMDEEEYHFNRNIQCVEINSSIPAEALLPYIKNKKIIFMGVSSILLYLDCHGYDIEIVHFSGLHKQAEVDKSRFLDSSLEEKKTYLSQIGVNGYQFVIL